MDFRKKKEIIALSVFGFIFLFMGITLAIYTYTKQGTTENVLSTSAITFIYTEIDGQGAGISIEDALPMSDNLGESQTGDRNVFNFKIKSSNPTSKYINYTVTVRNKSIDNTLDNYVKLNVKEVGGTYNKTKFYKDLKQYNNLNNERIIYQDEITNINSYEKDFQLRMWLSDTLDMSSGIYNNKSFSITVNVYANGADVSQSENCGQAICENKTFAQYMVAQDQAVVGQYVNIKAPTGGSDSNSFTGNEYTTDWMKAFARPIEYASAYQQKFTSVNAKYPDVNNISDWSGYNHGNASVLVPKIADDQIYNNLGKHVNMWFTRVNGRNNGQYVNPISFYIFGVYVPETGAAWKCVSNSPNNGYAVFSFNTSTTGIYIPGGSQFPFKGRSWEPGGYWGSGYGSAYIPGNFILVYNVDEYKAYLNTLSDGEYRAMIDNYAYLLAECNIPTDD